MNKANIRKRLIKIGFIVNQIYSEAIIIRIISNFLFIVIQYYIWKSIYENNNLNILSFKLMFSYVVIAQMISNVYPSQVSGRIGYMVKSGDIVFTLLNPYSFIGQLFFENIGSSIFKLLILNIPLYIFYIIYLGLNLLFMNIVKFIIIFLLCYIFYFIFELIFGIMSFYTTSQWGIQNLKYAIITLLAGRIIPINFYPKFLAKIMDFFPFKYLYNDVIMTILGKNYNFSRSVVLLSVNIIIFFIIYRFFLNKVVKKLTIQGG